MTTSHEQSLQQSKEANARWQINISVYKHSPGLDPGTGLDFTSLRYEEMDINHFLSQNSLNHTGISAIMIEKKKCYFLLLSTELLAI